MTRKKKRAGIGPKRTPPPKPPKIEVIGSSCTWGDEQLTTFKVDVKSKRDVNPIEIIPEKFFKFDHLNRFSKCLFCIHMFF